MSQPDVSLIFRFIVVYRREPREIPGASEAWRGWVQEVSAEHGATTTQPRLYFETLDELPDRIRELMRQRPIVRIGH